VERSPRVLLQEPEKASAPAAPSTQDTESGLIPPGTSRPSGNSLPL